MPGYARPSQYYAQGVSFQAAGDISATNVQTAIQEVDTEKAPIATGVRVYANSSARSSAIPSPTEGMVTYLEDTNAINVYNGTGWVEVSGAGGSIEMFFLMGS